MRSKIREFFAAAWLLTKESAAEFARINGFDRAAALAFYAFLSLIPIFFIEILAITNLLKLSDSAVNVLEAMTDSAVPVSLGFMIRELFALSVHRSWGFLTILILIWSATPLVSGMRNAFDAIFRPKTRIPFWRGLVLDFATVMVLLTILACGVLFRIALNAILLSLPHGMGSTIKAIYRATSLIGLPLALLVVYRIFAPRHLAFRHIATGSIVTSCLLWFVGPLFSSVLRYNPNMGMIFGSLKVIFLLFVWTYYASVAILLGTELVANMARKNVLVLGRLLSPIKKNPQGVLLNRFVRVYTPDEVIFAENGNQTAEMYHVLEGSVLLTKSESVVAEIKPGGHFGEMAMLLNGKRTLSAKAGQKGAKLVVISKEDFDAILLESPEIFLAILKEMAERLRQKEPERS